jgi:hypothetical protein
LRVAVVCLLALPATAAANDIRRYEYRIAWNGIPAASATIEVASNQYGEREAYVGVRTQEQPVRRSLRRFRDARATLLADDLTPISFSFDRRANDKPESTRIDFDDRSGRARSVYIKRARRKELKADARVVVDPITAAFRALSSDVQVGDALRYEILRENRTTRRFSTSSARIASKSRRVRSTRSGSNRRCSKSGSSGGRTTACTRPASG